MDPETTAALLSIHLERNNLSEGESRGWIVGKSALEGRGLIATKDIAVGELIFTDVPLLVGPRARDKHLPLCAGCYKTGCPLFSCDRGCGLPICSTECEVSSTHETDCTVLTAWKPTCGSSWSVDLLRALVPMRALLLDDDQRRLIYAFQCHPGSQHGSEVDLLKNNIEIELGKDEEDFMRRVCAILDTTSFETAALVGDSVTSLRGLYPMAALQNHCCTPNTRHYFDTKQKLYGIATLPIKKGDEITMTYTDLFWDTTLRRRHLAGTKHFFCECSRCTDPLEHGSLLGALRCANERCPGILLAVEPLDSTTAWKCMECGLIVKNRQIISIRSGLGSIAEELIYKSPRQIMRFIKGELSILVPPTNHVIVDMKLRIISYFGRIDKYLWKDLTREELGVKEKYCRDLLSLIDTLRCGECKMKGLISYELFSTLTEIENKQRNTELNNAEESDQPLHTKESLDLLKTAAIILENDLTAPKSLLNDICHMKKNRYS